MLLCSLPLLLQVPGQVCIDVGEALLQRRALLRFSGLERSNNVCFRLCFTGFLLLIVPSTLRGEVCTPTRNGPLSFPLFNLLSVLAPIGLRVVRRRVVADAVGHQLQKHWGLLLDAHSPGLLGRCVHGNEIVAIHTHSGDPKGRPTSCDAITAILILHPRGDGVAVIAAYEQRLRPVHRREVQARQCVPLRGGTVTEVSYGDTIGIVHLVRVPSTRSLWDVRAEHCMDCLHILLEHAVVHLQVPALAPVALVANVLVNYLLGRQASPQEHAKLPVLRPDHVLRLQCRSCSYACGLLAVVAAIETDASLALHRQQKAVID
mmetsp:Transcript_137377/g.342645  ORF Transcript_137377/g.342645 Transcript_137377/m.342645 type:complete len:319 (+) Transcript_137377:1425-2381(+)